MKKKTEMILLKKTYHGFEDVVDLGRDVEEAFLFPHDPEFRKIIGEFQGTVEVEIKFYPEAEDWTK